MTRKFLVVPLVLSISSIACLPPSVAQVDGTEIKQRKQVIHKSLLAIYLKQDKRPEAIQEYKQVLQLNPGDTGTEFAFGTYLMRGSSLDGPQIKEALPHLINAAEREPGNTEYQAAVGTAYIKLKNFEQARTFFRKAVALPDGAKYQKTLEDIEKYIQYSKQRQQLQQQQQQFKQQQKQQQKKLDEDTDDWG
jgi:hypothetical protein